jgi:hypothetical protein
MLASRNCLRLQARDFPFDVEKCALGKLLQNFFQPRQAELRTDLSATFVPTWSALVTDHALPISGAAHVEPKPVAPLLQPPIK